MSHFSFKLFGRGFTTIELMISQILGLIVIVAFISLIVPTITAMAENNIAAVHQESVRFVNNLLHQDIAQAGYRGCRNDIPQVSVVDTTSPGISERLSQWAYEKFEVHGIAATDIDKVNAIFGNGWNQRRFHYNFSPFGDILILRAVTDDTLTVATHNPEEEFFSFNGDVRDILQQSHLLELNDCEQNSTLHLSSSPAAIYDRVSDTTRAHYGANRTVNCTALFTDGEGQRLDRNLVHLGGDVDASCRDESGRSGFRQYQFEPGTRAHMIKPVAYYIGHDEASDQPALYKLTLAASGTRSYSEAILENVDNFRVLFGVGSAGANGPEHYFTALDMDSDPSRWNQVVSIKVWIMIRTINGVNSPGNRFSIFFPDYRGQIVDCYADHDITDLACPFHPDGNNAEKKFARRVISMEVALRNSGS